MRDRTICSTKFCTAADHAHGRSRKIVVIDVGGKGRGEGAIDKETVCRWAGHLGIGPMNSRSERVGAVGHSPGGTICRRAYTLPNRFSCLHPALGWQAAYLMGIAGLTPSKMVNRLVCAGGSTGCPAHPLLGSPVTLACAQQRDTARERCISIRARRPNVLTEVAVRPAGRILQRWHSDRTCHSATQIGQPQPDALTM